MNASEVLAAIYRGDCDDDLRGIFAACNARLKSLRAIHAASLNVAPGDTVYLSDSMKPKYLAGAAVTVERVTDEHVFVTMPHDRYLRSYSGATGVQCPKTIIVTP